jgi:hypothetical protein
MEPSIEEEEMSLIYDLRSLLQYWSSKLKNLNDFGYS